MEITLIRDKFNENETLGRIYCGESFSAFTCEDAVRDEKIYGKTAIPDGRYQVIITYSNRFKKPLPLLCDVPDFEGVRIHSGNTHEDTEGCVLVGAGRTANGVFNSRVACAELQAMIQHAQTSGEDVWLTILEERHD